MAEQNPIRYQDLIQPDDSIEKLIGQLDQANDAYNNLARSIQQEASRMSSSLQMVSGATSAGRATIKGMSQDTEKLLKAERDLNFARSETARKIAELKAMQKDEQTITKLTIQLNRASAGSYEALSAQYSLNKIRLNAMTEEYRKNTEEGQKLEKETRDIYDRMNELQKATGKYTLEVGNYEKAVGQLMGVQGRWMQNMQMLQGLFAGGLTQGLKQAGTAVAAFGRQLLALMANPIVATIAAIAAVFMALSKAINSSEQNTRALERIMAPFQRILSGILDVLQGVATWLLKGVEGLEKMAMAASRFAERLPLVGKYLKEVNDALDENIRLTKARQDLEDLERVYLEQNAQLMANSAKFRADAEKTNDPRRRAQLLKMAQAAETAAFNNEMQIAQQDLAIKEKLAKQTQNDKKTNDELAQARARVANLQQTYYQRQIRLNAKLRRENEKLNASAGGGRTVNALDEEKKVAEQRIALQQKTQDLQISMLEDGFTREWDIITLNYQRQIDVLRERAEKEIALREELNAQIAALETKMHMEQADLVIKYAEKADAAKKKQISDEERMEKDSIRKQMDIIDTEAEIRQLEIDRLDTSEKEKTRLRLEAEKERMQKLLELYEKNGKALSEEEVKLIREQIKNVDYELKKNKKTNNDLFDILGFNLTDEKKEAINTSLEYALDAVNQWIDSLAEAADKERQLADSQVERAQSVLEKEIEARANGYANEVEIARKEYEQSKKMQEKAIEDQKKAQRLKLAMDTISQASNLVTATSLIMANLPFPWFIPAIAVMWGTFAAAKVKALQMTSSGSEEYGEGTVELLEGGSHQSGNDIDLGRKSDGTRRRAEGGEFFAVINKRNSRKYRNVIPDVVNSLNNGTFAEKYMNAYDGGGINIQPAATNLTRLEAGVDRINDNLERPTTYVDGQGRTVVVYKNVKRILKN